VGVEIEQQLSMGIPPVANRGRRAASERTNERTNVGDQLECLTTIAPPLTGLLAGGIANSQLVTG